PPLCNHGATPRRVAGLLLNAIAVLGARFWVHCPRTENLEQRAEPGTENLEHFRIGVAVLVDCASRSHEEHEGSRSTFSRNFFVAFVTFVLRDTRFWKTL